MESGNTGGSQLESRLETVFLDTNILLNYIQRGIERDVTSSLFDTGKPDVVIGVSVKEEMEAVRERRADIYPDFVDFLLANDGKIEEYDPSERRPYFQGNDRSHIETIQMQLAQLDDRAEIQRRLRRFVRAAERRLEYIFSEIIPDALFDQQPGLMLIFALQKTVPNDDDCNVIGDAALWSAEGPDSSGVFLTMDQDDLLAIEAEINDVLHEERDDSWELCILHPSVLNDLPPAATSQD